MRYYDSPTARGGQPHDSLGQQILRIISNVGFAFFVLAVLTFTVIAVTYQPPDPLVQRAGELGTLLSSVHNATFKPDDTVIITGEDVAPPVSSVTLDGALTVQDVQDEEAEVTKKENRNCKDGATLDCADPGVKAAIELHNLQKYHLLLFFKYRQPVPVPDDPWSCDVAWKYRSRGDRSSRLFRDYRRFKLKLLDDCTYEIVDAGDWHSGLEAKPSRVFFLSPPPPPLPTDENPEESPEDTIPGGDENGENGDGGSGPSPGDTGVVPSLVTPDQGLEAGVDTVQVTEILAPDVVTSEFRDRKYLFYETGSDWCKDINHFQWSFLCALGESRYLQRTFVMNLDFCLPSVYSGREDETKDFRMFFDLEHLKNQTAIVEQGSFWTDWNGWNNDHPEEPLKLEFSDFHTTPQDLKEHATTLLFRKFPKSEPDNYWYRVCEGPAEGVIERPWSLLWKAKSLLNMVEEICAKMEWNFYALHVLRGEKLKNKDQYPNLDADTQADSILDKLMNKLNVQKGSKIYIATNEESGDHFAKLKEHYKIYLLQDFYELWSENSDWYKTTMDILVSRQEDTWKTPKFDSLMQLMVDTEVMYRAQQRFETFNDLTNDCKNGVNTC